MPMQSLQVYEETPRMTTPGAQLEQRIASEEVEKIKNVVMEVVSQLKIDTYCTGWRTSVGLETEG